jgi:ribose 5-phosphate isomerase RpiB
MFDMVYVYVMGVTTWLATDFGGGRHGRRVDKIDDIGKRYMK